jgi:hypothetical protein
MFRFRRLFSSAAPTQTAAVMPRINAGKFLEAAKNGKTEIVEQYLTENAANEDAINVTDEKGYTALMLAVKNGRPEIIRILLKSPNIGINATCKEGAALHMAISNKDIVTCSMLMSLMPNLLACDDEGNTPLMLAAKTGYLKMVLHLIRFNILLNRKNKHGLTVADIAYRQGYRLLATYIDSRETVKNRDLFFSLLPKEINGMINAFSDLSSKKDMLNEIECVNQHHEFIQRLMDISTDQECILDDAPITHLRRLDKYPHLISNTFPGTQFTILDFAVQKNCTRLIRGLIDIIVSQNLYTMFEKLITKSPDLLNKISSLVIEHAAIRGYFEFVRMIHQKTRFSLDDFNCDDGDSLAMKAAMFGNLEFLRYLLTNAPGLLDKLSHFRDNLLYGAACSHNIELFQHILTMRPEFLKQYNCNGDTPFMLLACDHPSFGEKRTQMIEVCFDQDPACIPELLKAYNHRVGKHATSLWYALECHNLDLFIRFINLIDLSDPDYLATLQHINYIAEHPAHSLLKEICQSANSAIQERRAQSAASSLAAATTPAALASPPAAIMTTAATTLSATPVSLTSVAATFYSSSEPDEAEKRRLAADAAEKRLRPN